MFPRKNIVENAINSADHTTLVAAVQAAGLVETLQGPGPFTVFAPTNAAFDKLPDGTVSSLLEADMKADLTGVLTYHVLSGNYSAEDIMSDIRAGGGAASYTTVHGGVIAIWMDGDWLVITDENGGTARVTIENVFQSNGVIHVVDNVLLPR